jgi:hypothetical protein
MPLDLTWDHAMRGPLSSANLNAILAQEELHALNANGALQHCNGNDRPIQNCNYIFPPTSFDDAIALDSTFTNVVLGTLQDVATNLGIRKSNTHNKQLAI